MLLAQLIPFLDAEIARLQLARDLLAFVPPAERVPVRAASASEVLTLDPLPPQSLKAWIGDKASPYIPVAEHSATPQVTVLRPYKRGAERASRRRKSLPAVDTALRGVVPAGPVVVSAQAVRQAQQSKSAPASKAVADSLSSFEWRPGASSGSSAEALSLRRLLDIGNSEDTGSRGQEDQLLRFMHS